MDERESRLARMERYWASEIGDPEHDHDIYHDDAVVEFPQSGERFEGVANVKEWRHQYPAGVAYSVRRISADGDLAVVELSVSYDGGPTMFGVQLAEFRGEKITRERIYVMDGWEAAEWRAQWRSETPADPPA